MTTYEEYKLEFILHELREIYIYTYTLFENELIPRIYDGFTKINDESEKHAQKVFEELCQKVTNPDIDPADLAEQANDSGMDRFIELKYCEQYMTNFIIVLLSQIFEQQAYHFLYTHIDLSAKRGINWTDLKKEYSKAGIDFSILDPADKLVEMRHLSNVIKHGKGSSYEALLKINPKILGQVGILPTDLSEISFNPSFDFSPEVKLVKDDIKKYIQIPKEFWLKVYSIVADDKDDYWTNKP